MTWHFDIGHDTELGLGTERIFSDYLATQIIWKVPPEQGHTLRRAIMLMNEQGIKECYGKAPRCLLRAHDDTGGEMLLYAHRENNDMILTGEIKSERWLLEEDQLHLIAMPESAMQAVSPGAVLRQFFDVPCWLWGQEIIQVTEGEDPYSHTVRFERQRRLTVAEVLHQEDRK